MQNKDDYDTTVMGSIDFQISYDKKQVQRQTVVQIIETIINTINSKYNSMSDKIDVHFHLNTLGFEDDLWFELNGLIHTAQERFSNTKNTNFLVSNYLNSEELDRFTYLISLISKEAT